VFRGNLLRIAHHIHTPPVLLPHFLTSIPSTMIYLFLPEYVIRKKSTPIDHPNVEIFLFR